MWRRYRPSRPGAPPPAAPPEPAAGADAVEAAGPRRHELATLALTYLAGGITTSLVVSQWASAGVTLLAATIMYSATGELALVAVLAAGGSVVAGILSGLLVSARFGLLCVSLAQRFGGRWPERAAAAAISVDPVVAVALAQPTAERVRRTYWRVSWWMFAGWIIGSIIGLVLGSRLGDPKALGLDVVIPASLVAIVVGAARSADAITGAALGAVITLVLVPVTPGGVPVLLSVAGAALALLVRPSRPAVAGPPTPDAGRDEPEGPA